MFVAGNLLLKNALADIVAGSGSGIAANVLANAKIGLYTTDVPLDQDTNVSDFTEPVYAGYARKAAAPILGPFRQQDSSYALVTADLIFQMTDTHTPTVVVGWFMADGPTGLGFLGGEKFPDPITLQTTDDAIALAAVISLNSQSFGGGSVSL